MGFLKTKSLLRALGVREPEDCCPLWHSENQKMFADYMVCRTRRLLWTMGFLEPEDCCRLWGSENSTVDFCGQWGCENQEIGAGYGL